MKKKQPPEVFCFKVVGLRPATLLKKSLWHRCFPVNFVKFLRTPFLQNTSGWLPLLKRKKITITSISDCLGLFLRMINFSSFYALSDIEQWFMNRVIKIIRMYSFEYTPLYKIGIHKHWHSVFTKWKFKNRTKIIIKTAHKLFFYENKWKCTVQDCSWEGQPQLLKTSCIIDLNSKFMSKKLIYSFKSDTKIHDHLASPEAATQRCS